MPITDETFFRSRAEIVAEMLAELLYAVPDAYTGEDGILRIKFEIEGGQLENSFLSNQLLLEDLFIPTAGLQALKRHGGQFAVDMKEGTQATGTLKFSGEGGTFIALGTEVAYDPGGGLDVIRFLTTQDVTLPNPGIPTAPGLTDIAAGVLPAGTYEYAVTFVTAAGETTLGEISPSLVIPANRQIQQNPIAIGGPGTIGRRVYRRRNGGAWARAYEWMNNTTVQWADNTPDGSLGPAPPETNTAIAITAPAEAEEVGVQGNVAPNTITVLTNAPTEVQTVTNQAAFTGGSDPEDTEEFRRRILEHIQNPGTGSPGDVKAWAEEISGVDTATVFNNSNLGTAQNGHVTVRISAPGGTVPSASVVNEVQAALEARGIGNITFHVATFIAVPTGVAVDVDLEGTYSLADVTPSVQTAITNYINELPVGATLYPAGIIDAVFGLAGITNVSVTSPATPQTTSADSKRTPGTITVT